MMNKKIIFGLIVIGVVVASISTVSAWWIFGGGTDVTVNGVDFHIPDGFESSQLVGSNPKTDADFTLSSDDGKKALAFIHIRVSDNVSPSSEFGQYLSYDNNVVTINGKECHVSDFYDANGAYGIGCAYEVDNKAVQLNVHYTAEYDKDISYKDVLGEIIK